MNRLTKKQALHLLPAIIDGEATSEERRVFLDYIETDSDVKEEFENSLHIKRLLSERLPRAKAPDHLKDRVFKLIEEKNLESGFRDKPITPGVNDSLEHPDILPNHASLWRPVLRYIVAAAVILIITLTTIEFLDRINAIETDEFFIVENFTAQHFINSGGRLLEPHFSTASTTEAEGYLLDHFGLEMTIPYITGAEFAGLIFADFVEGFETPLLEYVQHDIDETIYIFAFDINKITGHQKLKRHQKAVESCTTSTDFYVAEIQGYHVVSWHWDNNWYSAVSNHNGYDLASLIEPLNYSR